MKTVLVLVALASIALSGPMAAQEEKPVPKDSERVFIPGCTKGLVLTAGPRTEDQGARLDIPEGMHFRMQGPTKMMAEIKAHEGSSSRRSSTSRAGAWSWAAAGRADLGADQIP